MFDFGKKIEYEEFKSSSLQGFLLECPSEVRQHILLCVKCQQSLDPLFHTLYETMINDKIIDLVEKINEDIINHIKEYEKLCVNVRNNGN